MNQGPRQEDPLIRLSKRERLIAERFAEGLTYREIGEALYIAPSTVRTHIAAIYRKLEIRNKAALVRLWAKGQSGNGQANGEITQDEGRPGVTELQAKPYEGAIDLRRAEVGRRWLTILVGELRGLFQLSQSTDPEELRELIATYDDACRDVIDRFGGFTSGLAGGFVQAFFGYPSAHEDDPKRAVRAGLGLIEQVEQTAQRLGRALQLSVGVATGQVVVGDLLTRHTNPERTVVGGTLHLAARLQRLAKPGTLVVAESTRSLLGRSFESQEVSARDLTFHCVRREVALESRFQARQAGPPLPLVGRRHELELLLERWRQAASGEGQVVLLVGEPGIGKSRLVEALLDHLRSEDFELLRYQCTSYFANTPLHPIVERLERMARLRRDDLAATKLAKLEAWLGGSAGDVASLVPLFADLLSIPSGRGSALPPTPEQRREALQKALVTDIARRAAWRPVVVAFEDAHWIDPSSLEFLDRLAARAASERLLLLITLRPEFTPPPWIGNSHTTVLTLGRLTQEQCRAMVDHVTAGRTLPTEVLTQILGRTDGVPLFVEELTKTLVESKALRDEGDRYVLAAPLLSLAVPESLQASLMERLDRLGQVKEVAQIAAVIGREFNQKLLAAVVQLPEEQLRTALAHLTEAALVFRRGSPPEASYSFKHALLQDAAYGTLLKSRRQHLHARIAQVLEEQFTRSRTPSPHCSHIIALRRD